MKCPKCESTQISKNGRHHGKQNYVCKQCGRQFVESYSPKGYSDDVKRICLRMYVNGMGFRAIERVTGINHNTIINWVKLAGIALADAPQAAEIPEITELDELQTFVGSKKNKFWLWTAVNHKAPGILAWVLGDRSAETFKQLWQIVRCWQSFWYVTDGYAVYAMFIDDICHLVSKTYMTRVEGENTRLRHFLARLHRKTLCYSKSTEMLKASVRLLLDYLKYWTIPLPL
ncbi:IS1 family transposase [Gloeocapsopsis sp. IPPAS B-1203]|nr:IS1 family transposase [Gloeocapsopsis sp. IPPAS B-1203]